MTWLHKEFVLIFITLPSQGKLAGQNGCQAFVDTRLADVYNKKKSLLNGAFI
jgi:hypothetical protein